MLGSFASGHSLLAFRSRICGREATVPYTIHSCRPTYFLQALRVVSDTQGEHVVLATSRLENVDPEARASALCLPSSLTVELVEIATAFAASFPVFSNRIQGKPGARTACVIVLLKIGDTSS